MFYSFDDLYCCVLLYIFFACFLFVFYMCCCSFFFFKQKTAYEMRISDWSSDVCSSDLAVQSSQEFHAGLYDRAWRSGKTSSRWDKRNVKPIGLSIDPVEAHHKWELDIEETQGAALDFPMIADPEDRKSVVQGKSVSARVGLGGRRIINKNTKNNE